MFTTVFIGNEQTTGNGWSHGDTERISGCVKRKRIVYLAGSEWERKRG